MIIVFMSLLAGFELVTGIRNLYLAKKETDEGKKDVLRTNGLILTVVMSACLLGFLYVVLS